MAGSFKGGPSSKDKVLSASGLWQWGLSLA